MNRFNFLKSTGLFLASTVMGKRLLAHPTVPDFIHIARTEEWMWEDRHGDMAGCMQRVCYRVSTHTICPVCQKAADTHYPLRIAGQREDVKAYSLCTVRMTDDAMILQGQRIPLREV